MANKLILRQIRIICESITRCDDVELIKDGNKLKINLSKIHKGSKAIIPFILGEKTFQNYDTMTFTYPKNDYIINLNGISCIDIYEKLLSYEFNLFITSYLLKKFYSDHEKINQLSLFLMVDYPQRINGREYGIELGPQYCCNALQPFLIKPIVKVMGEKILIDLSTWIKFLSINDLKNEIINKMNLENKLVLIELNNIISIERPNIFPSKIKNSKIHHIGIVHEDYDKKIALAESWYLEDGSFGYATAGGYNPTPHFPEYGIAIESEGEFNLKILCIDKIKIYKHNKYCTGIVEANNYSGKLSATPSEFKKSSGIWISLIEIPKKKLMLRDTFQSIYDYAKFLGEREYGTSSIRYNLDCRKTKNTDGNIVLLPKSTFGSLELDR